MADSTRPPPSAAAIAIATAIVAGLAGFFLGQGSSLGLFSSPSIPPQSRALQVDSEDSDLSDEDEKQENLGSFASRKHEEYKLVLVVRTDLGMTKGLFALSYQLPTTINY